MPTSDGVVLVADAIAWHDPDGVWQRRAVEMRWQTTYAGKTAPSTDVRLRFGGGPETFTMAGTMAEHDVHYTVRDGKARVTVDGEEEVGQEVTDAMALGRENGLLWQNYYRFLAGMPMNLVEGTAVIAPAVVETEFGGEPARAVTVTFRGGGHTYVVYFAKDEPQLIGTLFYAKQESDGETIEFDGLVEGDGLRLPARRTWYYTENRKLLGSDTVSEVRAPAAATSPPTSHPTSQPTSRRTR